VLRSHATVAATVGGIAAGLTGAVPAISEDPAPAVPPVVTVDCPPNGVLPDGRACVLGPATGPVTPAPAPDPAAAPAPAPVPADPPAAPADPAAAAQPAPAPDPKAPKDKGAAGATDTPSRDTTTPAPPSSPTRVGPKHTERAESAPRAQAPRHTAAANPNVPASTGSAGLPSLTFDAPAATRAVPNVLLDRFPIPPFLLPIYQAAAMEYEVPWQVLAAINEIETDYGRNTNVSSAGALGWMQFMPSSWKAYGVDANGDGRKDPYNPADAIFAAARYLKAAGAKNDIRQAIFAYNHADWYVQSVMLRAKLVRALPDELVDALTGLTQGRFPVAGQARYPKHGGSESGVLIDARDGAAVIAVNDGVVKSYGRSKKLGLHLLLQDAYGNRYTYAHLGEIAREYPAPRPRKPGEYVPRDARESEHRDPKPHGPASAGRAVAPKHQVRTVSVVKERLFAHPDRPEALAAGGDRQLGDSNQELPSAATVSDYFTADFPLKRADVVLKPMRPGAQVIGGSVLGRAGKRPIRFRVRPAGQGSPRINPRPVLDGWRLLEATEIYKGKLRGQDQRNPSIGALMLMSKEALSRLVLADKRIRIYECGRRDISTGAIDRRVLITLSYLASSGLHPLVSALKCGHSYLTSGGAVSWHSSGNAVDIASINGTAILGHQGKGSVTDVTIRRLLHLQGSMQPGQIISLMTYAGHPNTLSMSDHANHIHVGFQPRDTGATTSTGSVSAVLRPQQWTRLVNHLDQIRNPEVKR
jgi:soluble lytic murein transglycosylase-like protein